ITLEPLTQTVFSGSDVTFVAAARGSLPLTYQWTVNDVDLAGQTNTTLRLTGVTTNATGLYRMIVTNARGTTASSPATLTVIAIPCDFRAQYPVGFSFSNALFPTTMTLAFDGTHYWSCSGGTTDGERLAQYDLSGNLIARFAPGLDFRSVFADAHGT